MGVLAFRVYGPNFFCSHPSKILKMAPPTTNNLRGVQNKAFFHLIARAFVCYIEDIRKPIKNRQDLIKKRDIFRKDHFRRTRSVK